MDLLCAGSSVLSHSQGPWHIPAAPFLSECRGIMVSCALETYAYHAVPCIIIAWGACRLFEELWVPLVNDNFAKRATVYMHLIGPRGKYLLHEAQMQPGMAQPPSDNAGKLRLLDALMALIGSNKFGPVMPSAKPEDTDTDQQTLFAQQTSADPLYVSAGQWRGNVTMGCKAPVVTVIPSIHGLHRHYLAYSINQ